MSFFRRKLINRSLAARQSSLRKPCGWSSHPLEPRLMLAGDTAAAVETAAPIAQIDAACIVFIDCDVDDAESLLTGVTDDAEIVLLDRSRDALSQISEVMSTRSNVSSLQVVSHGASGQILLGGQVVDAATLDARGAELSRWAQALTPDADILLFGCETAAEHQGRHFLQLFSQLTGADVAASSNMTGRGGDWTLEQATGSIETSLAIAGETLSAYRGHLPIQIRATGYEGDEIMELRIDGTAVQSWSNLGTGGDDGSLRTFTYNIDGIDADRISVAFTNDRWDPAAGIDSNLRVDRITVDGVNYETEDPSVFSTGTWKSADGIVPGFRESEILHTDGEFRFASNNQTGTLIEIRAEGSTGDEQMSVRIDGQTVATFDVTDQVATYSYQASGNVTADQIQVSFDNDLYDPGAGIDRNLDIDFIRLDGTTYQTEADDVFSTGTWLPADGITPGFRNSETLHSDGYFQYASDGGPVSNPGTLALGDTQITVDETTSTAQISVIRTDGSDGAATAFYQTLGVEAVDGQDFQGTDSGRVDFADGQTTATISVGLIDDSNLEAVETFRISLFRTEGAELGVPRTAIVSIVDDEAGADLVGHWQLNETSIGQSVRDVSGLGNNGVHQNIASPDGPQPDAPNTDTTNPRSLFFDGVNDFVSVPADASLDLNRTGTFTQSVWIKPQIDDNGYHGVLGFQPAGGAQNRYAGIWVDDQTRIHAGFGDGTNWNSFTTGSVLTKNEWNHVATSFDGTTYKTFVNGREVFSTDQFAGRRPTTTDRVDIGRVDNYFEGGIDDVRIYNRALSATEISNLIDGADVPLPNIDGQFTTSQIAAGFTNPVAVDWLPDGRILVAQQEGLVNIVRANGTVNATPLLDIRSIVNNGTKDRGMLGFAVHPDFENNPYIYVSYTYDPPEVNGQSGLGGPDGNGARVARISRFTVNGNVAAASSEVVLVGQNSTYDNIGTPDQRPGLNDEHSCFDANGNPIDDCIPSDETSHTIGDLEFGPDGMLYASTGDGGSFGRADPVNLRSLDLDSLAGKILRVDPITGDGLADNPFFNGVADSNESKVYSYGLRNPFRIAVNQDNGEVFAGDVGWTRWEEINTGRGANFGWPAFEGGSDGNSARTGRYQDLPEVQAYYATNPDVTAPAWARLHSDGGRAIVMGDFLSDAYGGQLEGGLLFTDIGDQILRLATLDADGNIVDVEAVSAPVGFLVDFQTGPDGLIYYTDLVNGTVGRLEFQIA